MTRRRAHVTEVVRRIDDTLPEVIFPNAIGDRSPRKCVLLIDEPARQCYATLCFIVRICNLQLAAKCGHAPQGARLSSRAGFINLAPSKHEYSPRLRRWVKRADRLEL